jgi:hypothetical protein
LAAEIKFAADDDVFDEYMEETGMDGVYERWVSQLTQITVRKQLSENETKRANLQNDLEDDAYDNGDAYGQ